MTIPNTAHFIWLGTEFPFMHVLSIYSCAQKGGFDKVILHLSDDISSSLYWNTLKNIPNLEIKKIEPERLFSRLDIDSKKLFYVYNKLTQPAAKSNILRLAILAVYGGVYLDTDTITIKSFDELRISFQLFFGLEKIIYPMHIKNSRNIIAHVKAFFKGIIRDLCRRSKSGWKYFKKIEKFYYTAPNNAVIGSEPSHPFIIDMINKIILMDDSLKFKRYALGTHLLQKEYIDNPDSSVKALDCDYFFPVGPEVSQHWFSDSTTATTQELLADRTVSVHWYASVRTKNIVPLLTPEKIIELRYKVPVCELAASFIEEMNIL